MKKRAAENDWPLIVEWGLIGSCTNSSYEDLVESCVICRKHDRKGIIQKRIWDQSWFGAGAVYSMSVMDFHCQYLRIRPRYLPMLVGRASVNGQDAGC